MTEVSAAAGTSDGSDLGLGKASWQSRKLHRPKKAIGEAEDLSEYLTRLPDLQLQAQTWTVE